MNAVTMIVNAVPECSVSCSIRCMIVRVISP